ncbi:MAG: hypothetical protein BJ554DRAFT_2357, partial [Olpidium bornovanus]
MMCSAGRVIINVLLPGGGASVSGLLTSPHLWREQPTMQQLCPLSLRSDHRRARRVYRARLVRRRRARPPPLPLAVAPHRRRAAKPPRTPPRRLPRGRLACLRIFPPASRSPFPAELASPSRLSFSPEVVAAPHFAAAAPAHCRRHTASAAHPIGAFAAPSPLRVHRHRRRGSFSAELALACHRPGRAAARFAPQSRFASPRCHGVFCWTQVAGAGGAFGNLPRATPRRRVFAFWPGLSPAVAEKLAHAIF